MKKVIKINGLNYTVQSSCTESACSKCAFFIGDCPHGPTDKELCYAFVDADGDDAVYFVAEPSKPLVEEFKEAAGITTEKTYTQQQVWDAYFHFYGIASEADKFCKFMDNFCKFMDNMIDPEYQEYLRLQAKFG